MTSEKGRAKQQDWLASFSSEHVRCIAFPEKNRHVDIEKGFAWLACQGINDVWIEAGGEFVGALLEAKEIDELVLYMAPKLLGTHTLPMAYLPQCLKMADHIGGHFTEIKKVGDDVRMNIILNDFAREYHDSISD